MKKIPLFLVAWALAGPAACATTYEPVSQQYLSATTDTYVKDGVAYDAGFFGGRLKALTEEVPEAHAYASDMRTSAILSFSLQMASLAASGTSIGYGASEGFDSTAAVALALVGGVVGVIAGVFEARAAAQEMDAINVFNDTRAQSSVEDE